MEKKIKLSIVIPVYNAELSIEGLIDHLFDTLKSENLDVEVILVNDFSKDNSWKKIHLITKKYRENIIAINLSKNFGEHNAVMAGYSYATGDFIVNIDDDFQNPPNEILNLLQEIQKGHDVVYSRYIKKNHNFWRNIGSYFNGAVATLLLKKPKGLYLSSFRIITNSLKNEIVKYTGPYPYIDGIILRSTRHIGTITVSHTKRTRGESNYTLIKLIRLWSWMFLNFSVLPLRMASILGIIFSFIGLISFTIVIIQKMIIKDLQLGWASIISSIFLLSGVQLLVLGLIGEYVGRLYISNNESPQFVIKNIINQKL